MITHSSAIKQARAGTSTASSGSGPTLLAEDKLDRVAAAGRKPGASGGAGATASRPK
jgi:hypothetical protein